MKKQLFSTAMLLFAAAILVGGVATHMPQVATKMAHSTSAAFRDGMFVAKFDIEQGRKLHLSSGRWSSDADRASFIAGYNQVLRAERPEILGSLSSGELAAYREGVKDGQLHRNNAHPFQVDYREASREERQAYTTGYQLGYYAQQDATNSPVLQAARQVAWR